MFWHCLFVQYIWISLHMRQISRFFCYTYIHCVCRTSNGCFRSVYVDFSNNTLPVWNISVQTLCGIGKRHAYSEWRKGGDPPLNLNVYAWLGNYYFNRTRLFSNIIIIVTPWLCEQCNIARITFAFSTHMHWSVAEWFLWKISTSKCDVCTILAVEVAKQPSPFRCFIAGLCFSFGAAASFRHIRWTM